MVKVCATCTLVCHLLQYFDKRGFGRYIDAKKIRDEYYQEGWATEFNLKLKLVMMEYQVRRCLVTPPEAEIGLFSLVWEELSEEQQNAANALGYSNEGRIKCVAAIYIPPLCWPIYLPRHHRWPAHPHNNWAIWDDYMHADDKAAANVLGLDSRTWPPPDFSELQNTGDFARPSHLPPPHSISCWQSARLSRSNLVGLLHVTDLKVKTHSSGHDAGYESPTDNLLPESPVQRHNNPLNSDPE